MAADVGDLVIGHVYWHPRPNTLRLTDTLEECRQEDSVDAYLVPTLDGYPRGV